MSPPAQDDGGEAAGRLRQHPAPHHLHVSGDTGGGHGDGEGTRGDNRPPPCPPVSPHIPPCPPRSYEWKGKVEEDSEVLLVSGDPAVSPVSPQCHWCPQCPRGISNVLMVSLGCPQGVPNVPTVSPVFQGCPLEP